MTAPRRRPTAADVARLSGFSTATVSYVLNRTNGQSIPKETRDRVRAAAEELGYVPSAHAQALARGTSNVVIVDLSEFPGGMLANEYANHLAKLLERAGYIPIVAPPSVTGAGHVLLRGLVSVSVPYAVITLSPLPPQLAQDLSRLGVERQISLLHPGSIESGIGQGSREQIRYLHSEGHKHVGYWGSADPNLQHLDRRRLEAAEKECDALGITLTNLGAGTDASQIVDAVTSSTVTAVAAYNDEAAFPVISALHRVGIAVPGDVAVIGIDNHPLSSFFIPALTTVAHHHTGFNTDNSIIDYLTKGTPIAPLEQGDLPIAVIARESA